MNKFLAFLLFLTFCQSSYAAPLLTVSNNMITGSGTFGVINLGTFDPFYPAANCSTYVAPNSCTANGRNPVKIKLIFNYAVSLETLTGSSLDLHFTVNNGTDGAGEVINLTTPANIYSLHDGAIGSFDLNFDLPLFGPTSQSEYGVSLIVDVTVNP